MNVVFIIFNRPEQTSCVFTRIREARPQRLLIVSDGPRGDQSGEAEVVQAVRHIAEQVDWPCEVLTNYATENMGCRRRVASGLTWAFRHVEDAIILEDDCLPNPSFFTFCQELLEYYSNNGQVTHISGDNFQKGRKRGAGDYYFSKYAHIWGWATWRRAWRLYDGDMSLWPSRGLETIARWCAESSERRYWEGIFNMVANGEIDTWDYPWLFSCWVHNSLMIVPQVNLVSNIGFDHAGTHTRSSENKKFRLPLEKMSFPLKHPHEMKSNHVADEYTCRTMFVPKETVREKILRRLASLR